MVEGVADRSYGVQVAKLAGLPPSAVARAKSVLGRLEKEQNNGRPGALDDLPLFAASSPATEVAAAPTELERALVDLDPDQLTPREALDFVYALKKMFK